MIITITNRDIVTYTTPHYGDLVGKPVGKRPLGRPRHRWEMGEQYQHSSSRKRTGGFGLNSRGSGQGQMAGFCEHSNELSGCVKSREKLDYLRHQ